jgi:hypothetical protein
VGRGQGESSALLSCHSCLWWLQIKLPLLHLWGAVTGTRIHSTSEDASDWRRNVSHSILSIRQIPQNSIANSFIRIHLINQRTVQAPMINLLIRLPSQPLIQNDHDFLSRPLIRPPGRIGDSTRRCNANRSLEGRRDESALRSYRNLC